MQLYCPVTVKKVIASIIIQPIKYSHQFKVPVMLRINNGKETGEVNRSIMLPLTVNLLYILSSKAE